MMAIKLLKRSARKIGHRLGFMTDWEQASAPKVIRGKEQGFDWYDRAYETGEIYQVHYSQSCYYFMWSVIADRILSGSLRGVLEIGCGPGQFANLLHDQGIVRYTGLDFSPGAIEKAKKWVPDYEFVVDDARTSNVYKRVVHDVIVCTEVLEHIQDDLIVVSQFAPGKRCFCTVPNSPGESHVRFFSKAEEVRSRYGPFFSECNVSTLVGTRDLSERFFLLDGIRNTTVVPAASA